MNKIKSIFVVFAAALLSVSCDKSEPAVNYLPVTPHNISGEWKLVEWSKASLEEGIYFYIELVRKDREYTIWQNFDSMGDMPHVITGEFNIELTDEGKPLIRGVYDYGEGLWSHKYLVSELTQTSMVWTAEDDPSFIQKFVRYDIPAELK